jgi:lipopolysaccharide/colanic/teichoic acid biosynthesis glycosyltransferase
MIRRKREGKDGVCFSMYKLRTMVADSDAVLKKCLTESDALRREWSQYGRLSRDPRIAGPVARLARRFSVDELPQIFNVVRGHMNLVGPRPLPIAIVANMRQEHRTLRQAVLPGITGLWQVSGRSELTIDNMGRLDGIYVRKRTVSLDLTILLRTVCAVLNGRGAY